MNRSTLQIKYHPAKKEIQFTRIQGNEKTSIKEDSVLKPYEKNRGCFVLQDYGNKFFDDIAKNYSGEEEAKLELITTKNDFEDFEQMVEYYNASGKRECQMNATLLAELPDMNKAFEEVKKHGENSIEILSSHKLKFSELYKATKYNSVKTSIEKFSESIEKEIMNIKERIKCLRDNNVNICFSGVYSSGKSALINAILGFSILPESIQSETAKMVKIRSPKKGEAERITFSIGSDNTEIKWDNSKNSFVFTKGPDENEVRTKIQHTINENKDKKKHEQIKIILKLLNDDKNISPNINLYFPISIDNDKIQFTIFDTPGTDSNYDVHKDVLQKALSSQTHSILVFVISPDKIEGKGNNALLSYLKEAEAKDSKTNIDINRSLFVINKIDSVLNIEDRKKLQDAEIKQTEKQKSEPFIIKLSDKKLLFTSAEYAYVAKATKNGIDTEKEKDLLSYRLGEIANKKYGRYYQYNHYAQSDLATQKMINASEKKLEEKFEEKSKEAINIFYVCSGLYALENAIIEYGEKYASAVRTYAIIDSVDNTLASLNREANLIKNTNIKNIENVDNQIKEYTTIVENAIYKASKNYLPVNNELPNELLRELNLNREYIEKEIYNLSENSLDVIIRTWTLFESTREKIKKDIDTTLNSNLLKLINNFKEKAPKTLINIRDKFKDEIIKIIRSNGEINDKAKDYICNIPDVKIEFNIDNSFKNIYDSNETVKTGFLWIKYQEIDKDKTIKDLMRELRNIIGRMRDKYIEKYKEVLNTVLRNISTEFRNKLSSYSETLKSLQDDKEVMEEFGKKIMEAAEALKDLQKELDKKLYKEYE